VDSYLGLLFCSTGHHVCFSANTMLFLLLRFVIEFEVMYYDTSHIAVFGEYCLVYLRSLVYANEL
jgi:hypothetical protein